MTRKTVFTTLLVLTAIAATGGFLYYRHLADEYPVRILENTIKEMLVASTTYKRIKVEKSESPEKVIIYIKFASQNRAGAMIDNEAVMRLIPEWEFLEKAVGDLEEHDIKWVAWKRKEQRISFPYDEFAVSELVVIDKVFSQEEKERINSSFRMGVGKGDYPFSAPAIDTSSALNLYAAARDAAQKNIAEKREKEKERRQAEADEALRVALSLLEAHSREKEKDGIFSYTLESGASGRAFFLKLSPQGKKGVEIQKVHHKERIKYLDSHICPPEDSPVWNTKAITPKQVHGVVGNTPFGTCDKVRKLKSR